METVISAPGAHEKKMAKHGEPSSKRRPKKSGHRSKYQCRKCKRDFMSDTMRPKCPFEDCGHGLTIKVRVGGNEKIGEE